MTDPTSVGRLLTPVGKLLEEARERLPGAPSQNEVARRAGTSGTTYRNTIYGVARHGGTEVPYRGAAATIALYAQIVGVESFQLREAGREDAALELQLIEAEEKYGHLSQEEKLSRLEELTGQINKAIHAERLDPSSRMYREVSRWVRGLAETIVEYEDDKSSK